MKQIFSAIVFSLSFAGLSSTAAAQEMAVSSASTSGAANGVVTVSAAPLHALGPEAISLVAFELSDDTGTWSLPPANDGGQAGDAVAGDGVWSLATELPNLTAGAYSLIVYVVDTGGTEFISDAFDVTLN